MNVEALNTMRAELIARHASELLEFDLSMDTVRRLFGMDRQPGTVETDSQVLGKAIEQEETEAMRPPTKGSKTKAPKNGPANGRPLSPQAECLLEIVTGLAQPFMSGAIREAFTARKESAGMTGEQIDKMISNCMARWQAKDWILCVGEGRPKQYNRTKTFGKADTCKVTPMAKSEGVEKQQDRQRAWEDFKAKELSVPRSAGA